MASSDIRSVINVFGLPMNIINIARRIHAYFGTIDWSIDIYVGTTYLRKRTTLRYFDLHTTPKFQTLFIKLGDTYNQTNV